MIPTTEHDSHVQRYHLDFAQQAYANPAILFNIKAYISDGFQKVCEVELDGNTDWLYHRMNQELMFSAHDSWIYFIVENETIVKCGESGNPLGIKERYGGQPISSSKCRFGRYRRGDGTDSDIRRALFPSIMNGNKISLWAKKCHLQFVQERVCGYSTTVSHSMHKQLEKEYLDYFKRYSGCLPALNKISK